MKKFTMTLAAVLCCTMAIPLLANCNSDNAVVPDKSKDLAEYTVIYFVSNGLSEDHDFDDQIAAVQPLLSDNKSVRFYCFNKYGRASEFFSGRYGDPGMVLEFELTSKTNLDSLRYTSVAGDSTLVLWDPAVLQGVLDRVVEKAPAKQYVLVIEGHGIGFAPDLDYPKDGPLWNTWVPRMWKSAPQASPRKLKMRGLVRDNYNGGPDMNMYDLSKAISTSKLGHLPLMMLNVCSMGDLESVTEIKDLVDYLIASPFAVSENPAPVTELVRALQQKKGIKAQVEQMFRLMREGWIREYKEDCGGWTANMALYNLSQLDDVIAQMKRLCDRLCEIYPNNREAIHSAADKVYRYNNEPHYDSMDYARLLAELTGDAEIKDIYEKMAAAYDKVIVYETQYVENYPTLPRFSLGFSLFDNDYFVYAPTRGEWYFADCYEFCTFHKLTNWGHWLRMHEKTPTGNPCGQVERTPTSPFLTKSKKKLKFRQVFFRHELFRYLCISKSRPITIWNKTGTAT